MKRLWLLFMVLIVAVVPEAEAQQVVRGRIFDAATGASLPAATIQIEGTYRGTITNADGAYELQVETLPATLIVRYIGYETARRTLSAGDAEEQDFRLQPVAYQLDEIVVSGEDPAIRIMREVIERKKRWRATLESYETEAYNRFTISNDTGIVSIIETFTTAFWDRERGMKETLKGRRETANLNIEENLPAALFVTNLYDDNIEAGGYTLIGVTHPNALRHYNFRLEGTRFIDDKEVYDISVAPKNKLKSAFVGRVSVLDSAYALIDVELRPGEAFLFPQPIERYDVTYRQQFSNFGGDSWLPVDFRADIAVEVSFGGLLSFPAFNIDQVSRFTDYAVNVPLPDSLYADDDYLTVDSVAVASDSLLSREGVAVPLSEPEQVAYAGIDSTMGLEKAFAPTGLLARFVDLDDDGDDDEDQSSNRQRRRPEIFNQLDLEPELWYNRVDAFHGGLSVEIDAGRHLTLGGGGGWSSGLDDGDEWSYHGEARVEFDRGDDEVFVEGRYEAGTAERYESDLYSLFLNSFAVLFGGDDYFDYHRREGFSATAGYQVDRWDATLAVGYRNAEYSTLSRTTSYDLFGGNNPLRENPPVPGGTLRAVTASLAIGDDFNPAGLFGQRRLALDVEHSAPGGLNSDFDYTRYRLTFDWRQNTLASRRLIPNALDLRLVAGTASGNLPLQRAFIVDGSLGTYRPFGAMRTLTGVPYEGDEVLALFWEHNFRTLPFEMLGLRALAQRGYNIIVFGGHARTWIDTADPPDDPLVSFVIPPNAPDGFHHEIGLSFSGLFGFFRLDFAKRLDSGFANSFDSDGFTIGFGAARIF